MEHEPIERSTHDVRRHLADVIGDAIAGKVTYITSNGRRVAAVIPITMATDLARTTIDRIGKANKPEPCSCLCHNVSEFSNCGCCDDS